jgi:PAS domain S-box-containing protein
MNQAMVLSLFSVAGFTAAIVVLLMRKRTAELDRSVSLPLLFSLLLYDFIVLSNFLEHSGITDYLDPVEDIAEIVFTLVFLFFINNWRKAQSEARFRALFKQAPLPMAELTRDGRILEVNDALAKNLQDLFGLTTDRLPTLGYWFELAYRDPEYREQAVSAWETGLELAYETDGRVEPKEREITAGNGEIRTILIGASIIGENYICSIVDITELKRAEVEKQKLKEQLLQSQKLEAIGNLAGGVAHDFNNMLGAIMGYAEMTLEEMPADHRFRSNLSQIMEAAERSTGLTRQLLTFARKQEITPILLDINESIRGILEMLHRLIGENIDLVFIPGDGSCSVRMDPTQLDQILANLCVNAKDAISGVGKVTVETRMVSIDETYGMSHSDTVVGDYVLVSVTDTGCGMGKDIVDHIFEPFFTTKDKGKGTGLGLSTVYGIVKQNNGMINVYSEPGIGTTFNIYLPEHSAPEQDVGKASAEEMPVSRGETILIVEDDPMVLAMKNTMRCMDTTICS